MVSAIKTADTIPAVCAVYFYSILLNVKMT